MHCYPSIKGNFHINNIPVNQICYLHGMYYSLWFGWCVCQGTGGAGYRGMLVTAILPYRCTSLLRGQKTLLFIITMMFIIFYNSSCGTEIHQYLQLNVSFTINVRLKHPLHLQICSRISRLLKHLLQKKYKVSLPLVLLVSLLTAGGMEDSGTVCQGSKICAQISAIHLYIIIN